MNKEEIEKKKRMLKDFSEKGQGQRVFFEEDLKLIRDILQELDQKESILDILTDKLKEVDKKYKNEYENIENMELSATKICVLQELTCVIEDIEEILNIIEGEKE